MENKKEMYCDTDQGPVPVKIIKETGDRVMVQTKEGAKFVVTKEEVFEKGAKNEFPKLK